MHALVAYASLGTITWVRLPVEGGRMAAVMFLDKRIQNGGFWDSVRKLCVDNTYTLTDICYVFLLTLKETCGRLLLALQMLLQEAATQHVICGYQRTW